jgi:hypothetical protein
MLVLITLKSRNAAIKYDTKLPPHLNYIGICDAYDLR